MEGWKCPVCGRGLSPFVSDCPCWQNQPGSYIQTTAPGIYVIPYQQVDDRLTRGNLMGTGGETITPKEKKNPST